MISDELSNAYLFLFLAAMHRRRFNGGAGVPNTPPPQPGVGNPNSHQGRTNSHQLSDDYHQDKYSYQHHRTHGSTRPNKRLEAVQETLAELPPADYTIHTDGSATNGVENGGAGGPSSLEERRS